MNALATILDEKKTRDCVSVLPFVAESSEKHVGAQIQWAIHARRILRLTVQGYTYIVEPYSYGKSWSGQEVVRVFIRQSSLDSAIPAGWHLFLLSNIEKIDMLSVPFSGARVYDIHDLAMFFIYCRVENATPSPSAMVHTCIDDGSCLFYGTCTASTC